MSAPASTPHPRPAPVHPRTPLMHRNRTAAALAVLLTAAACAPHAPASAPAPATRTGGVPFPVELRAAIDSVANAAVAAGELPGLAVGVWAEGRPVHVRGYGLAVVDGAVAVTDSTAFRIGSIAKQMTAAAVLRLEEQGRLSLSDPVARHVPGVPSHWEGVTLGHLLTHTGGVPSYTDQAEWQRGFGDTLTVDELIGMVRDLPLDFEPGTRWAYSNTGYLLLGPVIERVSGRTYARYVAEELTGPLGLRETGACREGAPGAATGYRPGPDGFVPAASNQVGGPFADGDLCASVRDLLRWTEALAEGRVVSPATYRRMTTRARLDDGREVHYGYGFDLLHLDGVGPVAEHGGGVPGFRAHLAHYPGQGVTIAVLTNRGTNTAQVVKETIARRLFVELLPAVVHRELPAGRISVYAGTYDLYLPSAGLGPFAIRVFGRDGQLLAEAEGTEFPLLWQGEHAFVDGVEAGLGLTFEVENGRAVRLVMERSGLSFEGALQEKGTTGATTPD
jgi:D-alanyl-D-alanine carboxypeptidase